MNLELLRISSGPESTLGVLCVDGKFASFTLEDEYRKAKVAGETRIPAGTYNLRLRSVGGFHFKYLARFPDMHEGMLWLQDVPGFEWILIHCGNTDLDTAGCILVGDGARENITTRGYLSSSETAYKRLYPAVARAIQSGQLVTIEVKDYA